MWLNLKINEQMINTKIRIVVVFVGKQRGIGSQKCTQEVSKIIIILYFFKKVVGTGV